MNIVLLSVIAFVMNLLWEFAHCPLYTTCRRMVPGRRVVRLLQATLFDTMWITFTYLVFILVEGHSFSLSILLFATALLLLAYLNERYALKSHRWSYHRSMPLLLGVGISPLLQLPITGLLALLLVGSL